MVGFPEGFDLEALVAPIAGDAPQGEDIRADSSARSPFYRLKDARNDARDAERQLDGGDTAAPDPAPLWRAVRDLALTTLAERTKDLEVAAWLTEAYVRSHGLAGLLAGATLIRDLAAAYWDGVFPLPDEDGVETRVAPVGGLNGRDGNGSLMQPLYKVELFERPDGTPVTFFAYHASEGLARLTPAQREGRIAAGTIPFEDMEKEAGAPDAKRRLGVLRDQAAAALEAWESMGALLDEKAGEAPPSTSHVRDLVREIHAVAKRHAPEAPPEAGAAEAEADGTGAAGAAAGDGAAGTAAAGGLAVPAGQVASREDALRTLEALATFFRRTEPVSPLAYTLDDAIRRARLSWPELLAEVVADPAARAAILTSLGIRPPEAE